MEYFMALHHNLECSKSIKSILSHYMYLVKNAFNILNIFVNLLYKIKFDIIAN